MSNASTRHKFYPAPGNDRALNIFLLPCVTVAGVYGGLTAKISIMYTKPRRHALPTSQFSQRKPKAA